MELKAFLEGQKAKCGKRIDEINEELKNLAKKNEEIDDEAELKDIGDSMKKLQDEKAELEAELKEVEDQIKALDEDPKDGEGDPDPKPNEEEEKPNPERAKFLVFEQEQRKVGHEIMTLEEREAQAKAFKESGKLEIRAVTIASGQIAIPTEVHGIENPDEVPYSSILDFVKVEDMTGAGYNKVSLLTAWGEGAEYDEGTAINEDNPDFGMVTIQPEKSFKTYSTVANEVLKTSPLNYYGKVEESAQIALRKLIANKIVSKAVGAEDDSGNAVNRSYELSAIDENSLFNISLELGGDEGVYGASTLVLNKATLRALGQIVSSYTKQHVYKIRPNESNPNIGTIENDGLTCRYIISNQLPSYDAASAGATCMLYGDLKSVEVDLFGAYDVKVSEDAEFNKDLLAIRGTAQVGVGVTRLYGLVEVKKPTE